MHLCFPGICALRVCRLTRPPGVGRPRPATRTGAGRRCVSTPSTDDGVRPTAHWPPSVSSATTLALLAGPWRVELDVLGRVQAHLRQCVKGALATPWRHRSRVTGLPDPQGGPQVCGPLAPSCGLHCSRAFVRPRPAPPLERCKRAFLLRAWGWSAVAALKTGGSGNTAAASAAAEGCRLSRASGHLLQAFFAGVAIAAACAASASAALAALATLARSACVTAPATTARRAAFPRPKRGAAAAAAAAMRRARGARGRAFHHSSQRRSCAAEQRFCGSIRPRREAGPVHTVLQRCHSHARQAAAALACWPLLAHSAGCHGGSVRQEGRLAGRGCGGGVY